MNRPRHKWPLGGKLNILVVGIILAVAAGLMLISYVIFCRRVDEFYHDTLQRAAEGCAAEINSELLENYVHIIQTDEFREIRERAVQANDDTMISDWMRMKESVDPEYTDPVTGMTDRTLLDDYRTIYRELAVLEHFLAADSIYLQYDSDGVTYNVVDLEKDFLYIGSVEPPIKEFEGYEDNSRVPPTTYHSQYGWLCTAIEPVYSLTSGEAYCTACADFDMTAILRERLRFLINSVLFVLVLTLVAIVVSMKILHTIAVDPLQELAAGTSDFAREDHVFTKDDVLELDIRSEDEIGDLYEAIRSMQMRIVDYTEHLTQVTAERERSKTEMNMAARIQKAMLPDRFPAFTDRKEFELYAIMDPARDVGGDFYDFFLIDDDHLAILIADVSDKGIPAALFMMASKILINYRANQGGTPSEILTDVNEQICKGDTTQMFVTVWLGIISLSTGLMHCANAGHEYPFMRGADGKFRVFKDKHGLPLGAMAGVSYQDYDLQLDPGDAIFVYTDGAPEASNTRQEFYGMERLEQALNHHADGTPQEYLQGVLDDIGAFTADAEQFDDLTMLGLNYKGKS